MTNIELQKRIIKKYGYCNTHKYCRYCSNNECICMGGTVANLEGSTPCATARSRMYRRKNQIDK